MRAGHQRGIAELERGGSSGSREPLGDRSPCCRRKMNLVRLSGFRLSRAGDTTPGQVLANGVHASARLSALQGCQAFRDTRNCLGVTEDFQCHFQALKVID